MKFQLLRFGIRDSPYERPNQPWVCGHSREGKACRIGPDARGRCRAKYECMPAQRDGHNACTRPPLYGGACEAGPAGDGTCSRAVPPCRPIRSVAARRHHLSRWAALLTLAVLGLSLGSGDDASPWRALSPGPLSRHHSQPAAESPEAPVSHCATCHTVAAGGPRDWLEAAFGEPPAPRQSELCLRCHELGEFPHAPHSRDLLTLAAAASDDLSDAVKDPWKRPAGVDLRCATCHQEHRGAAFDLESMDDETCQTCHGARFASFTDGHPEFSGYPYTRGTHLTFDHNAHKVEGFSKAHNKKEDRPFECAACHVPDDAGGGMRVRGFDETCASCHAAQIAANDGVVVLSIPGFEIDALDGVGEWPNEDETDLSPLTRMLLRGGATHTAGAPEYWELLDDLDPLDLLDLEPEEFEAVDAYAWDLKQLTSDLAQGGQAEFAARVSRALGASETDPSFAAGRLPADAMRNAREAWFPNLKAELESRASGDLVETSSQPPPIDGEFDTALLDDQLLSGGWYRQDADMTLRYRPARHEDEFMRTWFDVAAQHAHRDEDAWALLTELSARTAPGRCAKCHSIRGPGDAPEDGSKRPGAPQTVRWTSRRSSADERSAQRFSHATHFRLLGGERSCTECHILLSAATDPTVEDERVSGSMDFLPLRKQTCARCHDARSAGQSCLLCHAYHVGRFPAKGSPRRASQE